MNIQIAIDGPAGSGKSTICKELSKRLGYTHIETGAFFRAITLKALDLKININNEEEYNFLNSTKIELISSKIYLDNIDVTSKLRDEIIAKNISIVSSFRTVRDKVIEYEREQAKLGNIIMDGRDIGSVVLPNATLKFFLTADQAVRAKRRYQELIDKGLQPNFNEIYEDLIIRDKLDTSREIAPLKKADDAILIDSSNLTFNDVVNIIETKIKTYLGEGNMQEGQKNNPMEAYLKETDQRKIKRGDILDGRVVLIQGDKCFLDVKGQAEATLDLRNYTKDPNVLSFEGVKKGDIIKVRIVQVKEEEDGILIIADHLSVANESLFDEIKEKFEKKELIQVTVEDLIKPKQEGQTSPGFTVYYKKNIRCFLPISLADPNRKTGDTFEAELIDVKGKSIVVSEKARLEREKKAKKEAAYEKVNVGDVVTGVVKRIIPVAAFIELDGIDAMIHVSDICHEFVKDINKVVKVGDNLEVKVISKENGKVQVSRKVLLPTDFNKFTSSHNVGDVLKGKVAGKSSFGMFVELSKNVRGLLHHKEYSWNPNSNLDRHFAVGDEIEVKIISIDESKERISLSVKLLEDNPWSRLELNVGDITKVTINEIFDKGLIVDCKGAVGYIPSSQILTREQRGKVEDFYSVGDTFDAKVITFEPKRLNLVFSIRRIKEDAEKENYKKIIKQQSDDFSNHIS